MTDQNASKEYEVMFPGPGPDGIEVEFYAFVSNGTVNVKCDHPLFMTDATFTGENMKTEFYELTSADFDEVMEYAEEI